MGLYLDTDTLCRAERRLEHDGQQASPELDPLSQSKLKDGSLMPSLSYLPLGTCRFVSGGVPFLTLAVFAEVAPTMTPA